MSQSPRQSQFSKKFEQREYQQHILNRIKENRDRNILVELDCGLGKRVLTYKLVAELFPETRFIITVNSSSSLQETTQYLEVEYGGVPGLSTLSSRVFGEQRQRLLQKGRVIVCTARVLANTLRKGDFSPDQFDALVINEVDTILRRVGRHTVLVHPWNFLLDFFHDRWIIGLSGTLRDDHVVLDEAQLTIREELKTLAKFLPNAELISMDELAYTDLEEYITPTVIDVVPVQDDVIRAIALVLDNIIQSTREEIYQLVKETKTIEPFTLPQESRLLHLILSELPIPEKLGQQYSGLLMIRKYLYGMTTRSFRRFLHHPHLAPQIDVNKIMKDLPKTTPKTLQVLNLVQEHEKVVILSSYLNVVREIKSLLEEVGVNAYSLTGSTVDKQAILAQFKEAPSPAALILSPVGERDLDLPEADLVIIYDVVNTTKTIYQKMKRTRGGRVVFLTYADTSEVAKVRRLVDNIMQRYPWSTRLGEVSIFTS